jgi:hypothetical protein
MSGGDQPTPDQLEVLAELSRIRMAGIMFYFLMVAFVGVFAVFAYAVLWNKAGTLGKIGFGGIDATVGWSFKHVVGYLFPHKSADEAGSES